MAAVAELSAIFYRDYVRLGVHVTGTGLHETRDTLYPSDLSGLKKAPSSPLGKASIDNYATHACIEEQHSNITGSI